MNLFTSSTNTASHKYSVYAIVEITYLPPGQCYHTARGSSSSLFLKHSALQYST